MKTHLVSIIIVNWNGGEVFRQCLSSLSKVKYSNKEVIIVDNGSNDGTEDLATIKNDSNLGFAPANNQGYEISKGKYILFLNNDTRVHPEFLKKMVARMQKDESIGVMQPKIYMMDKSGYLDNAGSFITKIGFLDHWGFAEKDSDEFGKERQIFSAKGACMLVRREVIEKVGLFDDGFISYFEESDFCWRVWLAGFKVMFFPEAHIYHKVGFTIKRLDVGNINFHYYKNRITSLIKNLGFLNLITILPVHVLISLGISIVFLLRGNWKASLMIIKAIVWNLINLGRTLKKRHRIQSKRKVSDSKIFSTLSKKVDWLGFYSDFKRVEKDIKTGT